MSDILTRAHELEADLAALGVSANHSLIHVGSGYEIHTALVTGRGVTRLCPDCRALRGGAVLLYYCRTGH